MRAIVVLMTWLTVSCAGAKTARPPTTVANAPGVSYARNEDVAEAAWSQRLQATEAASAIDLWTQRVGERPDDSQTWLHLAQAHHFVAAVHADDPAVVIRHAQAGLDAAQHALSATNDDSTAAADVPSLYWRARNLALLAATQGYAETLLADAEVGQLLATCERLQPGYDHAGSLALLAQRMARPIEVGRRDLPGARMLFTRALAAEPGFLPHRVALAEHYAVIAGDRPLFEHELVGVRDALLPTNSDAELPIAQARARELLAQIDELFE